MDRGKGGKERARDGQSDRDRGKGETKRQRELEIDRQCQTGI